MLAANSIALKGTINLQKLYKKVNLRDTRALIDLFDFSRERGNIGFIESLGGPALFSTYEPCRRHHYSRRDSPSKMRTRFFHV
jgi:hypothetical protein